MAAKKTTKKGAASHPRVRLEVDERRAQLLDLGMQLFSSTDYDEVSLDDVAKRLAISKGLIYHYFPTKKDFFSACVEEAAEKLLEMTEPDESLPPVERLTHGVRAYFQYVETHRGGFVALMRGRASGEIAKILERTRQRLLDRILEGMPFPEKDDPRLVLALRGWIGFVEMLLFIVILGITLIYATGGGTSTTALTSLAGLSFSAADLNQAPIVFWRAA